DAFIILSSGNLKLASSSRTVIYHEEMNSALPGY
ncbi:MAG: hypothetical protein ACI8SZ_002327, partial [Colwellia sp.]